MYDLLEPVQISAISAQEETDLVAMIKTGDQVACTRLVRLFGPRMMFVARRFMCSEDDCYDVLQDAFISAFRALERFESNSRLSTWLHRIVVNSCLMKLRRGSSRHDMSLEDLPTFNERGPLTDTVNPSAEVEMREVRSAVRRAIDQLPEPYRKVLLLRDIEERDTATTAFLLTTTENNVKRRLRRARQALCALLEPMRTSRAAVPA